MTMMLFRRAKAPDLNAIHEIAKNSGVGITTLTKDRALLKKRLAWSNASFGKKNSSLGDDYYLFVLEDPTQGTLVGTSAIKSIVGCDAPFYSYKVSKRTRICHSLNIRSDYDVLSLVNDNQGHSEICTLFLDPNYRLNSNGLLLSRARFLFIANYPMRFADTIIAEMRGVSDEAGNSPFWDNFGSHFFHMPFEKADKLTLSTNKQFIADLMPRSSIYVKLLAPAAQSVIGQPHLSTLPAMNILLHEGFRYNNYIDIFDAGPTIEAPKHAIRTAQTSKVYTLKAMIDEVNSKRFILANTHLDFRATVSHVVCNEQQHSCIVSHETAALLQIKCGDSLRIAPL